MRVLDPVCQEAVLHRLKGLREEIEQAGEISIAELETPFALALSDVCCALGLSEAQTAQVLGSEAATSIQALLETRFIPVEVRVEEIKSTLMSSHPVAVAG